MSVFVNYTVFIILLKFYCQLSNSSSCVHHWFHHCYCQLPPSSCFYHWFHVCYCQLSSSSSYSHHWFYVCFCQSPQVVSSTGSMSVILCLSYLLYRYLFLYALSFILHFPVLKTVNSKDSRMKVVYFLSDGYLLFFVFVPLSILPSFFQVLSSLFSPCLFYSLSLLY